MSTNPRIAFWLPSFETTGLQTSTIRVAESLIHQGMRVDLVLSHTKGSLSSLVKDPIRIVDLNLRSGHLGRGLLRVIGYVLRERPDAMCACAGSGYLLAALVRLVRSRTQIWIWELSTTQHRQLAHTIETYDKGLPARTILWRTVVRGVYYIAQRAFITTTQGVIANSRAVAEEIACNSPLTKDRIHVIYNACFSDEFHAQYNNKKKIQNRENKSSTILSVGRLSAVKDLDVLLRAFRVLRDQRPVRLVIVGDGPLRSNLEGLIDELGLSNDVELAGFQIEPFSYLDRADLFVLSSKAEPFGNVLVEAMACGLPIVSTDCTGPREILEYGRYGPLVPIGDHLALAKGMSEVLDDPPDGDFLRMRALEFHADKIASQYREVLGL